MPIRESVGGGVAGGRLGIFRGMRGTLLAWFVLLALLPMVLVGSMAYDRARKALTHEAKSKLMAVRKVKQSILQTLFQSYESDILFISRLQTLKSDMVDMEAGLRFLGADKLRTLYLNKPGLADAKDGSAYSVVHSEEHAFFENYIRINNYEDVILIDTQGHIFFTYAKGEAYGAGLISDVYHDTNLGRLFQKLKTCKAGEVLLEDAALFGDDVALFMGTPVYRGEVCLGYLVLQLPLGRINQQMSERAGMGRTGETYLVGPDLRLRSDTFIDPEFRNLKASLTGTVKKNGIDTRAVEEALAGKSGIEVVTGYGGNKVLSAYGPLNVKGLRWAVIAEMDLDEALAPIMSLRQVSVGLALLMTFVAVLLSLAASGRIVSPIRRLTEWSERIADGELSQVDIKAPDNEIGVLNNSFRKAVESLKTANAAIVRQTRLQSAVNQVFRQALTSETEEELAKAVLHVAEGLTESRYGFIGMLNASKLMDIVAINDRGWKDCNIAEQNAEEMIRNMPVRGIDRTVLRDGISRILNSDEIPIHPDRAGTPPGHPPLSSLLAVPFKRNDQSVGVIVLANKEEGYSSEDQETIEAFSAAFYEVLLRKEIENQVMEQGKALKRLSSELEIIIDSIPGAVFYKDLNNNYLRVNKYTADAHNLTKGRMEGRSCFDLYPKHVAQAYWDADLAVAADKKPQVNVDERWETAKGSRWVSTSRIPNLNDEGEVIGIIVVSMDIDDRRKAEEALREKSERLMEQDWLKTGIGTLNEALRGDPDIETLASRTLSEMARYLNAQVGAFYVMGHGGDPSLSLMGSYAYNKRKNLSNVFRPGEGLVGQAALEKQQILLRNIPEDYVRVTSGLGEHVPRFICVTPVLLDDRVLGVIELGTLEEISDQHMNYLSQACRALAMAVQSANGRTQLDAALEESQRLTEELQVQQEELKTSNEELEEQARLLKDSEERLKNQQEELQVSNEELEEKNDLLERQTKEVERAKIEVEEKAEQVALASKHKSEFLANMSHELRTPLNSLLLLARSLAENKSGNLTEEQVESAKVIHGSGNDLLNLINEILDLSKIEAGRMDLHLSGVFISELAESVRAGFRHLAEDKGLALEIVIHDEAPQEIVTDRKRIEQIIRNLMSNALKFTDEGKVEVAFGRPSKDMGLPGNWSSAKDTLSVSVTDTGIGIAKDQQKVIFEAFQQADGGTSRRYGGTGLGLSLSRELAHLLGGDIQLKSEPGKGSVFTLYVPVSREADGTKNAHNPVTPARARSAQRNVTPRPHSEWIPDDRDTITESDKVILLIEDDPAFARILHNKCHDRGFKCLAAPTGEEALSLAGRYVPSGIILDLRLPGMDGWAVLTALKDDIRTRHVPVHIISVDEAGTESLRKGAVGHATKPISQEDLEQVFQKIESTIVEGAKRVLVVEDDPRMRADIRQLVEDGDVEVAEAATGKQALEALRTEDYGCVLLDLNLPDMDGGQLINQAQAEGISLPPVVVHTARDLSEQEELELREHAESIVIKDVRSQERLLDEVTLFLHRMVNKMPEMKKQIIRNLHETDVLLKDKKVLVVDDDMRTTFAMSRLLAEHGIKPLKAGNGEQALEILNRESDISLVLMDIMMPVMDGYEAVKRIRANAKFRNLPIIVLTAKAMPEDRHKCIEAGANDYLAKPVDQDRLISMLRVWLYR